MAESYSGIIVIIMVIIIGIVLLAALFMKWGPFSATISEEECRGKLIAACSEYRSTGNTKLLDNVPNTCYKLLYNKENVNYDEICGTQVKSSGGSSGSPIIPPE